mmetsp:Transcript_4021/g.5786  ORF Transcript_4021/g.5786 Transcript_4021/m.5786 type:complete len:302 (-) Transcript_4021:84-989(-)|eukprot:CAMPEP_0194211934 /NCGR_PEP_ID=MMETSP0156-20130528/11329_1 /TAXON_ID=33649 /ORGANISM="Thalassionema nitzschioides, Strain L26-B" /LENGTH=301 /DNA_ID=CAMNT_0038939623 /DNA_START=255 /DNA_END=1160 /DNA_ORIENTATION=-
MSINATSSREGFDPPGNCRFAIPKKGRLYEKVTKMLKGAGIEFRREPRLDVALCVGKPITLVFLPAADIAKYVGEGNVDIGITGQDIVRESNVNVTQVMELGFGKCKLCVQAPVKKNLKSVEELAGGRIVTSFPSVTREFFKEYDEKLGKKTSVNFVSGSVEAACGLGLADAVVDLVETGTTMRAAGLEIVHDILQTQAILISNPHTTHQDIVDMLKRRLDGYITATKFVMVMYNVSVDLLEKATVITPGKRSPTITALDDPNFKAVSSLVATKDVSEKMDQLHEIGATDILVIDIHNSLM